MKTEINIEIAGLTFDAIVEYEIEKADHSVGIFHDEYIISEILLVKYLDQEIEYNSVSELLEIDQFHDSIVEELEGVCSDEY